MRSLGEAGEIEGESEAILLENNIDFADFSKEIIDSLPQLPWSIPKVTFPKVVAKHPDPDCFSNLLGRREKEEGFQK